MKPSNHLLIVQSTSTILDNIIKTLAMIMALSISVKGGLYSTIAFVLPYILFSPLAGELGDKYSKTKIILGLKLSEILLIVLLVISMHTNNSTIMLIATLLSGIQASFISPSRLGLIPELAEGNILKLSSWMDGVTFMSVLVGTGIGLMRPIASSNGIHHSLSIITAIAIISFFIGLYSSYRLYKNHVSTDTDREAIDYSWFKSFNKIASHVSRYGKWDLMWSISMFWGTASVMIAEAEPVAVSLGLSPGSIRLIVPVMSIGIGLGSFFVALTGFRNILISSIIMAGLCGIMCLPLHHSPFLLFAVITFLMCFAGGILSSALYARVMKNTGVHTSAVLATNNICNSLVMLVVSVILIPVAQHNPRILLFITALISMPFFIYSGLKKDE